MADSVNFNPFIGKGLTIDQIMEKLDTDKDGKISDAEYQTGLSWVAGGPDDEGDVVIGDEKENKASTTSELDTSGKKLYGAAQKNGVKDTASSQDEIKEYLNTIQDEYIQQYMQDNPGMTSAEKSSFVTYVKSQGTEFINQFLQKNAKAATFDTQSIAAELINKLDSAVETRKATQTAVNEKMEEYKNSADTNFKALADYTDKADDDYVTSKEFAEMKKEAVNYLMGAIMNGNEDAEFMKKFDSDYKNNGNYQDALNAINDLKACSDPAKMQELIEKAETALSNFLGKQNVDGTSKLNDAIVTKDQTEKDAKVAAQKAAYKEQLSAINDKMLEDMSNQLKTTRSFFGRARTGLAHSQDEVNASAETLNKILDKFVEEYSGDGKNIESDYRTYVAKVMDDIASANLELKNTQMDSADSFQSLKDNVNNAGTYISKEEGAKLINQSVDFLLSEMAQGKFDISLLEKIYPDYAKDENFVQAKALMEGFTSSITRSEDLAKVKELLTKMMEGIGVDKLKEGVNAQRDVALTMSGIQRENLTSSIPGYDTNESVSTGRYKDRQDALDDIQNQAKQKLESLRKQLKAMYKEQLGADYDESKIDAYIDEAIYSTINQFTDMRVDKNGKHYTTDDAGFVTSKSGKKSRGVYNVKQLVDTFLSNLESISSKATTKEEGKNPVSLDSVMSDTSLSDDYQDNKTVKYTDLAKAKLQAKNQMNIIANQLKNKLRESLGSDYDSTKIDQMVFEAMNNVLNDSEALGTAKEFRHLGFLNMHRTSFNSYSINTGTIANKFYEEFNKLYEASNSSSTTS